MTYLKPELLAVETALESIRGSKLSAPVPDNGEESIVTDGAYDVDE